jgi:hypothetical protein
MRTEAAFGRNDTGLVAFDMNISVKTMAGADVDTTGWSMVHSQRGVYDVNVPLCTVPGTIYISHKIDPNIFYDGFINDDGIQKSVIEALNSMLELDGATYRYTANALEMAPNAVISGLTQAIYDFITGKVAKGTIVTPLAEATVGKTLVIYQNTSYQAPGEIQITLGADFAPWLDGAYNVTFAASSHSTQMDPDILAPCTIFDQAKGIVKLALSVEDTNVDPGIYRWQVILALPDESQIHMTAEGRLEIKSLLKRPLV